MLLKNVVIGHSLESALFAYYNQYYYIPSDNFQPLFFEECLDFSLFGTNNKKEIYDNIKDLLGFLSLNLDYSNLQQIRIQDDQIKIFDDNLLVDFQFEKCYICETAKISHENDIDVAAAETYKVIDDFKINRIGMDVVHLDPLFSEEKLLNEIHFYNSLRVDGTKYVTDAVTVSNLSREDLYDFDYSDTIAVFKLKNILNNMGYYGLVDGTVYKNGKNKIRKIIIEHLKRYVLPIDNNTYKDTENVKFINPLLKDFVNGFAP